MRSCKRFEKMLPGYLHGELYEKDYHALRTHLKQCASCRDELEAQQMALQLAGRSLSSAPVPVRLTARRSLQAKHIDFRQSLAKKIWCSPQLKAGLAAGVVAVLFISFSSMSVVFSVVKSKAPMFSAPEPLSAEKFAEMAEKSLALDLSEAIAKQDNVPIVNHFYYEDISPEKPEAVERLRMALKKPIVAKTSEPKPPSRIVAQVKMAPSVDINIPDLPGSGDALLSNIDGPDDFAVVLYSGVPESETLNGLDFYAKAESPSIRGARPYGGGAKGGKLENGNSADFAMGDYLDSADVSSGAKKESVAGELFYKDVPERQRSAAESEVLFGTSGPSGNALALRREGISKKDMRVAEWSDGDGLDINGLPDESELVVVGGTVVSRKIVGYDYTSVDAEEELSAIFDAQPEVAPPDMPADDIFAVSPAVRERAEYNPYVMAAENAFSTFSIDVDTASYGLARNQIFSGVLPEPESVRTEEFVNSFDYDYRPPSGAQTFAVYNEMAPSPFRSRMQILKIGVKGRRIGRDDHRGAVLTLVVDTSGSMSSPERIGLVKQSLGLLLDQLDPSDKVAIVQFGGEARLVSEHTPASEKDALMAAIDALQPGGPTQFDKGLELGYQVAVNAFQAGDSNRIIIMSDGVANLGELEPDAILNQVEAYRKKGIYLSVLGFGAGTYDDNLLERLANHGDGAYVYVDTIDEARHLFVDQLAATLHVIASDVKIQVEFNPKRVVRYRQIGYENRQLTKEQFRDDSVDAGEVGSGQSVTALYEVELAPEVAPRDPIATVYVRYRRTDNQAVEEINSLVADNSRVDRFEEASPRFQLAACVAEFAERLRCSPYADATEMINILERLQPVAAALDLDGQVQELLQLISMTRID
ncbi:MAG: von Willebrand factor type A domain-containing protein [Pontiellaceae bacterium]|nr:von Willebrand factor type A domain-containing protein [Pontiellaceae bacterium]